MKTIYIDVKDSYVSNVLSMLESVREKPLEVKYNDADLHALKSLQESAMVQTWENDADKAWDAL